MESITETNLFGKCDRDVYIWKMCQGRIDMENVIKTYLLGKCNIDVLI